MRDRQAQRPGPRGEERVSACYTTARVAGGRVLWGRRHAERLVRDAAGLGLGGVDLGDCLRAFEEAARTLGARAPDPIGEGIVRLEVHREPDGAVLLRSEVRPLGLDPPVWTAATARPPHPGPARPLGAKRADPPALRAARQEAERSGVDEVLLFDPRGFLVEGARSCVAVVDAAGRARTPPLARGGVAGIARALVLERCPELAEEDVSRADLGAAREVVALNAVRGARPVVRLDGLPVGDGRPGAWARRLARALAADREPL